MDVNGGASPGMTCPVCLKRLKSQKCHELGKPRSCDHFFCFSCIFEWSKNVNTCPVDRLKFRHIDVYTSITGEPVRTVDIPEVKLVLHGIGEDLTYCEVCHQCTREDQMLLCDGCDKGYHLNCLVPPLSEVPVGDWYCESCDAIVQSQYSISLTDEDSDHGVQPFELDLSSDANITDSDSDVVITIDSSDSESCFSLGGLSTDSLSSVKSCIEISDSDNSLSRSPRSLKDSDVIPDPLIPNIAAFQELPLQLDSESIFSEESDFPSKSKRRMNISSSSSEAESISLRYRLSQKSRRKKSVFSEGNDSEDSDDCEEMPPVSKGKQPFSSTRKNIVKNISAAQSSDKSSSHFLESSSSKVTPSKREPILDQSPTLSCTCISNESISGSDTNSQSNSQRAAEKSYYHHHEGKSANTTHKQEVRRKKRKRKRPPVATNKKKRRRKRRRNRCRIRPIARARTAATHTPRQNAIRAAVRESYRHDDKGEGLEWAQAVLARMSSTPRSGYHHKKAHKRKNSQGDRSPSPVVYRTYGFTPNRNDHTLPPLLTVSPISASKKHTPPSNISNDSHASSSRSCSDAPKLTAQKRIEHRLSTRKRRALSRVLITPVKLQRNKGVVDSVATNGDATGKSRKRTNRDILGELCQGLDDLENKNSIVQRDGTVVPIRNEEPKAETCKLTSAVPLFTPLCTTSTPIPKATAPHKKTLWQTQQYPDDLTRQVFPILKADSGYKHKSETICWYTNGLYHKKKHDNEKLDYTFTLNHGSSNNCGTVKLSNGYMIPKLNCSNSSQTPSQQRDKTSNGVENVGQSSHSPTAFKPSNNFQRRLQLELVDVSTVMGNSNCTSASLKPSQMHMTQGSDEVPEFYPPDVIRRALDNHYSRGEITNQQYGRIFERANRRVQNGPTCSNEKKIVKLVADYVDAYSSQGNNS